LRPDTVLTFGPDGGTYHPDHIAVSDWTTLAVGGRAVNGHQPLPVPDYPVRLHYASVTPRWEAKVREFIDPSVVMMADKEPLTHPVEQLSIHLVLTGELLETKYRAMMCQQSQVGPMLSMAGEDGYRYLLAEESFRDAADED